MQDFTIESAVTHAHICIYVVYCIDLHAIFARETQKRELALALLKAKVTRFIELMALDGYTIQKRDALFFFFFFFFVASLLFCNVCD